MNFLTRSINPIVKKVFHTVKSSGIRANLKSFNVYGLEAKNGFYLKSNRKSTRTVWKYLGIGAGISTVLTLRMRGESVTAMEEGDPDDNQTITPGNTNTQPLRILQMTPNTENPDRFSININTNAIEEVLNEIGDRNFVVYSVNGPTRSGKSFILNQLLSRFNPGRGNFPWKSGTDRQTVGIHIWPTPFFIQTEHAQEIGVILLDCQGLFDPQSSTNENNTIFALSNLLSSVMIYNVMGKLDENTLEKFQYQSEYSLLVSGAQKTDISKLVVLLRDYSLGTFDMGYHNQYIPTAIDDNYFHWFMSDENLETCNRRTRNRILTNYNEIEFFLIPHPGKKFLKTNSEADVDEDFKFEVDAFLGGLLQEPSKLVKTVAGAQITARNFIPFVNVWATAFFNSEGALPEQSTLSELTRNMQNQEASKRAVKLYKSKFQVFLNFDTNGYSDEALREADQMIRGQAFAMFNASPRFGGAGLQHLDANFLHTMHLDFDEHFIDIVRQNKDKRDRASFKEMLLGALGSVAVFAASSYFGGGLPPRH